MIRKWREVEQALTGIDIADGDVSSIKWGYIVHTGPFFGGIACRCLRLGACANVTEWRITPGRRPVEWREDD